MAKILIVDDEIKIVEFIKDYLTMLGYEVIPCCEGKKAVEILVKEGNVDILILDYHMKDIDGEVVLETMKIMKSETPVIMMTGYMGKPSKEISSSVREFMTKPVKLDKLKESIENILGRTN